MVWKNNQSKNRETIESRGRVINAEEKRILDDKHDEENTFRDFGEIDFTDHEVDEAEKRARKELREIDRLNSPWDKNWRRR